MWSITNSFRQRNDCLKSTLSRLPQVSWFIWALSLPNHVPLAICCWNIAEENPLCIIDILPTIFQNVSNDRSWGWCMWFNRRLLGHYGKFAWFFIIRYQRFNTLFWRFFNQAIESKILSAKVNPPASPPSQM